MSFSIGRHFSAAILGGCCIFVFAFFLSIQAEAECPAETCSGSPTDVIERDTFCVYYNQGDASDYSSGILSLEDATAVADMVQEYWDRYVTDFGFAEPLYTGKLEVCVRSGGSCNGGTSASSNNFSVNTECFCEVNSMKKVLGHELFHRVQYSYDGSEVKWFKEGTARAMEDNAFDDIDNWSTSLTACSSSFNKEKNDYLNALGQDITSIGMRYEAACWWKYFTEQYGSTAVEPQLGVDAFLALWEAAATEDDVAAVNSALSALGAGVDFGTAFRRFTVATYTKDLSSLPDDSYDFIDEDQVGNPAPYGPIVLDNGGTITAGSSATFNNESPDRYSALYYEASIGADCPLVSVSFHKDSGDDAFYHIVTQNGMAFESHFEGSGDDWVQSFFNNGITKAVAIIGGQENSAQVDIEIACVDPVLEIKMPNDTAMANVGPFDSPGKFLAQVVVTDGTPTGPVVAGLTNSDFAANVNGVAATVTGGGFIQEQYWLVIQAPAQVANGTYDLEVELEESGTATVIASDTSAASVTYTPDNTDHVLVVDRSGSMLSDGKMEAAENAAKFYVDITRDLDGVSVVPFNSSVDPAPFDIQSVDAAVRTGAKDFITALTASGATSIGDGLGEAVNQITGSATGNPLCSIVLLSDGMENSAQFYSDVQADVMALGCPVTTVAFGPASDETLLQDIATDNGGIFFYNDVFVSSAAGQGGAAGDGGAAGVASLDGQAIELADSYEFAQGRAEGRQRILSEGGLIPFPPTEQVHRCQIDASVKEAVFSVNWNQVGIEMVFRLVTPSGGVIESPKTPYTFQDFRAGHLGWRISSPEPGDWQLIVTHGGGGQTRIPYKVFCSGRTNVTLEVLLPDRLGSRFVTGNVVPIYAFLSGDGPLSGALVDAIVSPPEGPDVVVRLFDDGQHNDGTAGDGFYANTFTRSSMARAVQTRDQEDGLPTIPKDEGSYRVRVRAQQGGVSREVRGAFSVLEGLDENQNAIPDAFENENGIADVDKDPDLDQIDSRTEYVFGTDPFNSDSDGGGEHDGSEALLHGQNPLDPRDDQIEAPEFFRADVDNGMVNLSYDVKPEYVRMIIFRRTATGAAGWAELEANAPLNGKYSDTVPNGETFAYRLIAVDEENHFSAVLESEAVTPTADPFPPEARVVIDNGSGTTADLEVALSFVPTDREGENALAAFEDIAEVMISNNPFFIGARFDPFAQDVAWQLTPLPPGTLAQVFVRFRDAFGNESRGTETGSIVYDPSTTAVRFIPGDANASGEPTIGDCIDLLFWLFLNQREPVCLDAADFNDNGDLTITDCLDLLGCLFLGDRCPTFECMEDPTPDDDFDCQLGAPECR